MHAADASQGDGHPSRDSCAPSDPPDARAMVEPALSQQAPPTGAAAAAADDSDCIHTAGARPTVEGAVNNLSSAGDHVAGDGGPGAPHPTDTSSPHAHAATPPVGAGTSAGEGSDAGESCAARVGAMPGMAPARRSAVEGELSRGRGGSAEAEAGHGELLRAAATVAGVGLAAAELRRALRSHFDGLVATMSRMRAANEVLAEKCEAQAEQADAVATFAKDAAEAALRAENREEEEELLQALLGLDCTLAAVEGELDSLEAQRAHRRPPTTT